jgi:NAD(P)H-dependent FMN reductase
LTVAALRLLVIAGSARAGSWNRRLAEAAARLARDDGADVRLLDLRELALPVYDADLEVASGVPEGARRLRTALLGSDALLLVSPEYNGFPPPLVINAFDWLSRLRVEGDAPAGLAATAGKPVALLAASPGPLGGLRAMNLLRQFLQMTFAMIVVPQQFALGHADQAFDDAGALVEPKAQQTVHGVLGALQRLAQALAATR